MPEPGPQGDDQFQRAGDAEDHADPVAVERPGRAFAVARVVKRLAGDQKAEELGGVGRFQIIGGDPEVERREIDRGEKPAAPRIGSVGSLGVGVEVVFGSPVARGDLRDRVAATADVGPVAGKAVGLGEETSHSDDRHRDRVRRIDRVQSSSPISRRADSRVWFSRNGPGKAARPRRQADSGLNRSSISEGSSGNRRGVPGGRATPCPVKARARASTAAP